MVTYSRYILYFFFSNFKNDMAIARAMYTAHSKTNEAIGLFHRYEAHNWCVRLALDTSFISESHAAALCMDPKKRIICGMFYFVFVTIAFRIGSEL